MRRKGRGDIVKISDLFDAYRKRLRAPQGVVISEFQELILDLFGIEIPKKYIKYSVAMKTLSVNTNSQLKTEILLKKSEVLRHLKGRLGAQSAPKDII
jgi:hypothetical protein